MSNISFFKQYKSHLFGVTGTLGNQDTARFLKEIYDVDVVVLPPHVPKEFKQLAPALL